MVEGGCLSGQKEAAPHGNRVVHDVSVSLVSHRSERRISWSEDSFFLLVFYIVYSKTLNNNRTRGANYEYRGGPGGPVVLVFVVPRAAF